ncbi:MAG TPA: isocitrate/isopropylmalate family dehydrogenase [Propionibacteriaceae bacterium]|nr:isocitrate/isopropylmalate family dehydrogenase [Propionibacteriaceae bacterium]
MQYVNLRPVRMLPGVQSPLRNADGLDLVVVRENVEGEYSEAGGRLYRGLPEEMAVQAAVFTRKGVTRVAEFAVAQASGPTGLDHLGHQVERDHPHHAVLGRGGGQRCRARRGCDS